MLQTFWYWVENQFDWKIKVVRSCVSGVYYGWHMDVVKRPLSFFEFGKDHGKINQYAMSSTPQWTMYLRGGIEP